jgi:hypothetical protein
LAYPTKVIDRLMGYLSSTKGKLEHNTSVYLPTADIRADIVDGSEVPEADLRSAARSDLFDRFVGARDERRWHGDTEPFGDRHVDLQLESGRPFDR